MKGCCEKGALPVSRRVLILTFGLTLTECAAHQMEITPFSIPFAVSRARPALRSFSEVGCTKYGERVWSTEDG